MTICDQEHDEICYGARRCPCCELMKEIGELKDRIIELMREAE